MRRGINLATLGFVLLGAGVAAMSLGQTAIKADGIVESTSGGFKFPDGSLQVAAANSYERILVVAKAGGHFTSIQAAINSTTNTPSDRYLVYVAPGTYDEKVVMKPGVDVQGAGVLVTTITAAGSAAADTGTVVGANDAELSHLTVKSTGGSGLHAIAIYNNMASPRITDVSALAQGGDYSYGVYNTESSPAMTRVFCGSFFSATRNYGVYNSSGSNPAMDRVNVFWIDLFVDNYGIYNGEGSNPVMRDVSILLTGGANIWGIYNYGSSPTMNDVTVRVSLASGTNEAVYNETIPLGAPSSPILMGVHLLGDAGATGTTGYGLHSDSLSAPVVHHSILRGSTNPLLGGGPKVAYSQLDGALATMPANTCIGAYTFLFAPLGDTCV